MECAYIKGFFGLRCPFYHSKEDSGIEALTREFKERVCEYEDSTWLPILEEHTAKDKEQCLIYKKLTEIGLRAR